MGTETRHYKRDGFIIFVFLAFVFAYFYQDGGWNGNSRLGLIFAAVQEKRLSIDNYVNNTQLGTQTGDRAYFNGHYYSDKAIGPAVIGIIIYAPLFWAAQIIKVPAIPIAKWILTFLVIGLPSAIAGSLMYILFYYLTKSRFRAFVVTLAIALGTLYLPYSVVFFSHQLTSSLLFSAFCLIFLLKEKPNSWRMEILFLIGFFLGWALISEFQSAIIILPLIIYYFSVIWRKHNDRKLSSLIVPFVAGIIPLSLQLLYNKLCFGGYFSFADFHEKNLVFYTASLQGLGGIRWPDLGALFYMTLHPTMGVFWESPMLLLSIVGAGFMLHLHRFREEALLSIWIICSFFVIMSGAYMWWGGNAVGPRYIIPVLPFFGILLVFVPKRLNWLLVSLSLISIGQMMIVAASTAGVPDTMMLKIASLRFFEYSNIYSYCLKQLLEGNFSRNLGYRLLGINSWSSLIPLFVVMVGTTLFFFRNQLKTVGQKKPHYGLI